MEGDWKWFRLIKVHIQGLLANKIETTNYCNTSHLASVSLNISNNFHSNPIDECVLISLEIKGPMGMNNSTWNLLICSSML